MSKRQVVGMMSEWSGVIRDMFRQFDDGSLTLEHARAFTEHRNPFVITDIRQEWQDFYRKYFRAEFDFSDVPIPDDPGDFTRIIFIPRGMTLSWVIKTLRKHFPVSVYLGDLDRNTVVNLRITDRSYAIRTRDCVEADKDLMFISASQFEKQNTSILNLLERLIYELKYYCETNQHLDVQNTTLCAGPRPQDGGVLGVKWDADNEELLVCWHYPSCAYENLRARRVISSK
ncbi:MAG: hypothetical protein WC528_03655 [Patescibacteria group bacterium]